MTVHLTACLVGLDSSASRLKRPLDRQRGRGGHPDGFAGYAADFLANAPKQRLARHATLTSR
jgi:hypothetical protein